MNERVRGGEACVASANADPFDHGKRQRAPEEIAAAHVLADRLRMVGLIKLGDLIAQAAADAARVHCTEKDS
jgi:hypothetical protein